MSAPLLGLSAPLSLFGGGMPGFSASASSGLNANGSSFGASGAGDWNVNVAGSGASTQSAVSAQKWNWYLVAGAALVGYLVWNR